MVKIAPRQIDGFLKSPDRTCQAFLFYGPDAGLVQERGEMIVKKFAADIHDPFVVAKLSTDDVKNDPARLADEALSQSFMGGQRVVWIRDGGDGLTAAFDNFFNLNPAQACVVVEAGELRPNSSLRKFFEQHALTASVGCYADEGANLTRYMQGFLQENGYGIESEALMWLSDRLGGNRLLIRSELEKLMLYAGTTKTISMAHVLDSIADTLELSTEKIVYAAAGGDLVKLDQELMRGFAQDLSPVAVIRAMMSHLDKLHQVLTHIAQGENPGSAVQKLRPPLFFKVADQFKSQVRLWSLDRVGGCVHHLIQAEISCKSNDLPANALCARALYEVARQARLARKAA